MFQTTLTVLQPIEDRLEECEATMEQYTNIFFKQEDDTFIPVKQTARSFTMTPDGSKRKFRFYFNQMISLFIEIDKLDPNSELNAIYRRRKQIYLTVGSDENEKERKTVENLRYKPFQQDVYTDWVSDTTVEVMDIIDKVTRLQKFKVSSDNQY